MNTNLQIKRIGSFLGVLVLSMVVAINCTIAATIEQAGNLVEATGYVTIDLMPLFLWAQPILVGVVGVLVLAGAMWGIRKLGLQDIISKDLVKGLVDKHVDDAVQYGINQLEKADWTKIETKNAVVGHASNYVISQVPSLAKKAGLDQEKLTKLIEAKMLKFDPNPGQWEATKEK